MATNKSNHDGLIFNLALLFGGYYFIAKPILEKIGVKKDPEVEATETKNKELLNAEVKKILTTEKPTKSDFEWKAIADSIYKDLQYAAKQKNRDNAAGDVCLVKNTADFILLWKYFAKRQDSGFVIIPGISKLKNLQQYLKDNLPVSKINAINKNYRSKGIKFQY